MAKNSKTQHTAEILREEKKYSQSYLDIADVILLGLDHDGSINLINHKGCRVLGYEKQELIGNNWFQVCVPENEHDSVFKVFRQIVTSAADFPQYFENHVQCRSGEQRLIAWHNVPLRDTKGIMVR